MFGERFSRSWELVKASYEVLKQDKELLWFPVMSTVGTIIVTILFFIPLASTGLLEVMSSGAGEEMTQGQMIMGLIIAFLFYLVMYTVIIFSQVALIGAAMIRLNGGDPTVRDGFRIASERIGAILGYAAISATVGMILQAIRGNEDNFVGQIVASLLGTAWSIITFLVVPVLVIEKVGPIQAIKRSTQLLKKTWGEQLIASAGIGLVGFLATLAVAFVIGAPLLLIASAINSTAITILAVLIVVVVIMGISLFFSTLSGIFQAALYRYATEGTAGEFFPESTLSGAFQHK